MTKTYGAATFINKDTGKVITTLNSVSPTEIGVSSNYRIPRTLVIKNSEVNKDIYNTLLNHVSKTLKIESDQIIGLFNISLDGNEIILEQVTK
jgi:uncharacterized membrane protein YukC